MPSVVISSWPTWFSSSGDSLRPDRLARVAEHDLAAFVAHPLRRDAGAAHLARGVDVGEERDRRDVVVHGRRERPGDVAVLVHRHVGEPDLLELVAQEAQQVELALGARVRLRFLVGPRVDADVAEEPLGGVLGELGGERRLRRASRECTFGECVVRLVQLYAGLVLYGISSSLLVLAGLGLDPWDVFHQGLSRTFGLAIGTWAIIVGVAVLLLWIPLRQRPGIGTVSNVVLVGADDERRARARARAARAGARESRAWSCGVFLNGVATGAYIGAGLGPGPRDGLMTGLAARGHSIRVVRTGLEVTVLVIGWLLGGTVGVGTLVYALSIGPLAHVFIPLFARGRPTPEGALEAV